MKLNEIHLNPSAGIFRDYLKQQPGLNVLFDYTYESENWLKKRVEELSQREYNSAMREALVEHLLQLHNGLHQPEASIENIKKLSHKETVVIVGGQQAGLLTGPLYTIYKALSVLIAARQQEKELGLPVVPVFWVAGEDHDFEEIRFVYRSKEQKWKKHPIEDVDTQCAASEKSIPKEELARWLDGVFESLPETEFTKPLFEQILSVADTSDTYTEFFIQLMNEFFLQEGLVFVDANHPDVRKIEAEFFKQLIHSIEELQTSQQEGLSNFTELGYTEPIITEEENAHLFIRVDNKRLRLDYEDGQFTTRNGECSYTKEELLQLVDLHPECFSNNVVTRPLMQEWLLPVLAFIPGPGELAYWATLKPAFHQFGWCMPPLIPRLQLTIVPRTVQKWVSEEQLSYQDILEGKGTDLKKEWLDAQHQYPIEEVTSQLKTDLDRIHQPLRELAEAMDTTLHSMSKKNLALLTNQIHFMEKRMNRYIYETHRTSIKRFDEALFWLHPMGAPQERILHPIIFINIVGQSGLSRLFQQSIQLNGVPKLLFL
ncbi:bacillithiol biosynthesis cysteine-adding enzyme BshC [Alkalicoccobacillus porphyridii]|uniref:Putative cysteine ligase BshC n=1 Tax=Alkalicoccobacillus porphyridii TaxID=2597270 RepID=A0A553ZXZ2_9BACI|nr:bacillithiol biosynthesis cysteine-adding enzyme BshC [Alkalicoccobacillus porphyridii]TSB46317.1 bacillithiol biosynthesis cysteine-adding enzyme BshC [Alkalicoccobacillus porphyridii]